MKNVTRMPWIALCLFICALAACRQPLSADGSSVKAADQNQSYEDYCLKSGTAGAMTAAFRDTGTPGTVDESDLPNVAFDENTLAIVSLYDNQAYQGRGRCRLVLTKGQTWVTLVNGTYPYQSVIAPGRDPHSRAKSIKLYYLAKGYKVTFSAGGYNPHEHDVDGRPYFPFSHPFLKDAATGFTVLTRGMMASLAKVDPAENIQVTGEGQGERNFENVIARVEVFAQGK